MIYSMIVYSLKNIFAPFFASETSCGSYVSSSEASIC